MGREQTLRGIITLRSDTVLSLLEEVGRNRALSDLETDILEDIVCKPVLNFRWTTARDQALLRAGYSKGAITRFAKRHGITENQAWTRHSRLKKGQVGKGVTRNGKG